MGLTKQPTHQRWVDFSGESDFTILREAFLKSKYGER